MENITIRKATPSDLESIVELRLLSQEHFEKSNGLIWRITDEGKKLLKEKIESDLADTNTHVLLAGADGKIIGFIQGVIECRSDYVPRVVGQVSLAYVVERFRRRGVGKRLVKELCVFFNSNKVETLTVRYIIGNKEAERFWRKLGFESIMATGATHLEELEFKLNTDK